MTGYDIGEYFGGAARARAPPKKLGSAHAFISFTTFPPKKICVCQPNIFDKSTPVGYDLVLWLFIPTCRPNAWVTLACPLAIESCPFK